ncbi:MULTISPECIES: hypothetical protein [Cyanophyceae]|uniref:hypothetical protein n=1 Tax=Cyanophyceae TaxID=3028117 RepID=UPI001688D93C|nr:hypothetical protein [Trichocoleus sp. FACHB-40]MBD2002790.1 hypothetical protein [Trichocoleus sp. FACHB-40]
MTRFDSLTVADFTVDAIALEKFLSALFHRYYTSHLSTEIFLSYTFSLFSRYSNRFS